MTDKLTVAPVVALDIGNVCIRLEPGRLAARLGFNTLDEVIKVHPQIMDENYAMDRGQIDSAEFLKRVAETLPNSLTTADVLAAFLDYIGDEIPGLADAVGRMHELKLRPVFFSNISDIHYEHISQKLTFTDRIDGAVLSYVEGCDKPDPAFYQIMERDYCDGLTPALYIDDRPENIAAAVARGWNSYQFGTADGIHEALEGLA